MDRKPVHQIRKRPAGPNEPVSEAPTGEAGKQFCCSGSSCRPALIGSLAVSKGLESHIPTSTATCSVSVTSPVGGRGWSPEQEARGLPSGRFLLPNSVNEPCPDCVLPMGSSKEGFLKTASLSQPRAEASARPPLGICAVRQAAWVVLSHSEAWKPRP